MNKLLCYQRHDKCCWSHKEKERMGWWVLRVLSQLFYRFVARHLHSQVNKSNEVNENRCDILHLFHKLQDKDRHILYLHKIWSFHSLSFECTQVGSLCKDHQNNFSCMYTNQHHFAQHIKRLNHKGKEYKADKFQSDGLTKAHKFKEKFEN